MRNSDNRKPLSLLGRIIGLLAGGVASASAANELPADVQGYLIDPPEAVLDSQANWGDGTVSPTSIALLRRIVLNWDHLESGAPRLDPRGPFLPGTDALPTDLAKAESFVRLIHDLNKFTSGGQLAPGAYMPRNVSIDTIRESFVWLDADDTYLGLTSKGEVLVTEAHIKLVREMLWEWPNEYDVEDVLDLGDIPTPLIDGKRPYGAMSYYQLDVHRVQEWPVEKKTDEGYIALTDAQQADATRLHHQMLGVMQVFMENAEMPE